MGILSTFYRKMREDAPVMWTNTDKDLSGFWSITRYDDIKEAELAQSKLGDELLPQEFLNGSWLLIIFAGIDTSRNSLSGTIRLMTEFQDQRAMVLDDPSLIPKMSEEALRMVSPVMHMRRTANEDTVLNGQVIAKN